MGIGEGQVKRTKRKRGKGKESAIRGASAPRGQVHAIRIELPVSSLQHPWPNPLFPTMPLSAMLGENGGKVPFLSQLPTSPQFSHTS